MSEQVEYIVVGSGPGGGTVAARLAENGKKVLLLEAGGDPLTLKGSDATTDENRLPQDYEVPVFHAFSTENRAMKWDYFVRHYGDTNFQKQDPKYSAEYEGEKVDGVLYPRAGCLGGCSAHNAMITVYPQNDDWNHIAELTGDNSWQADHMRSYYEKLEDCRYRGFWWRWLAKLGFNPTRHGFSGWLSVEKAIPWRAALRDWKLIETLLDSIEAAFKKLGQPLNRLEWLKEGAGDPNDWRLVKDNAIGLRYPPLATRKHKRNGSRERVLDVAERFPENLTIEMNALVTRVLFDDNNRAIGVEYLKGERLYKATCLPRNTNTETIQAYCSKEVILSGGAFNTPQLLMLSGVGPKDELAKHDIEVRVDLPGVGRNMQDRYEVGVVNRMNFDNWEVLEGAKYEKGDPQYQQWEKQQGVYTTNGAILAVIKRSLKERPLPDLFCFALLAKFRGYFPGYSELIKELNYMTWAILKAHTNNTAGYVALRSSDPTDTPYINFQYFQEGNDISGEDLQSVVEGIKFVREMTQPLKDDGIIAEEELPGEAIQTDEEIADFIRKHAWGHHASCTCPIGKPDDDMSVLDSNFKVKGVEGLRVVDASAFPKIPGYFIVSAVYMIGEKAADVILQQP